jgi:hypothetical protein
MMTDLEKVIEQARAAVLPFESWERLPGESAAAHAAFCAYRDFGAERNIRKAVEGSEKDEAKRGKRYRVWRSWSTAFRWRERAADYDRYLDKLKQAELRKTIEAQGERRRVVAGKMLTVVEKKLDLMDPADLAQGTVAEWVATAIKAEREDGQCADTDCLGASTSRNATPRQGEITFAPEFEGL